MSNRELAAGIRRGLALWPNADYWCQGDLVRTGPNGELQRCALQMLVDGLGLQTTRTCDIDFYWRSELYRDAEAEIIRVADKRGVANYGSLCSLNNSTDFATMKSLVEEAATNLEKPL